MVRIKEVRASAILDSRKEKTILVTIKTDKGSFSASAPNGKSKGKYEAKSYRNTIDEDINSLESHSDYIQDESFSSFNDLEKIEDVFKEVIGGNTLFAFEAAVLKAIASESKKQVWQIINPKAKNFPRLVGNAIGGGKHSESLEGRKPDFQEFLVIPKNDSPFESFNINRDAKTDCLVILKNIDEKFKSTKNDENAWQTSLNENRVLEVLKDVRENAMEEKKAVIDIGLDVAASSFYSRKKYKYLNPKLERTAEEQLDYMSNLISNHKILYVEDPFQEEDYESFSKLLKKNPKSLIVGDDLTVTNSKRLQKAIDMKSINALIVKPNQCGSLIEVKRVCDIAKKNKIKTIFSHRSGETEEDILADLAFGFQADFIKCGIDGKEREAKIKRLIEIEKTIK